MSGFGFFSRVFQTGRPGGCRLNPGCGWLTSTAEQIRRSVLEVRTRGSHPTSDQREGLLSPPSHIRNTLLCFCGVVCFLSSRAVIDSAAAAPRAALDLDSAAVMKTEAPHPDSRSSTPVKRKHHWTCCICSVTQYLKEMYVLDLGKLFIWCLVRKGIIKLYFMFLFFFFFWKRKTAQNI